MKLKMMLLLLVAAVFSQARELRDIPYYPLDAKAQGNVDYRAERCKLHLSIPDKEKGFPTLVYLHGGGLTRGSGGFPKNIDRTRAAVVAVNYRLSGARAKCPDYIYDAAAAVAWTVKNIEKYGGDPKKVYVTGHSAGGYLTAMIALDKKYLAAFGVDTHQIAGYFPVSGQMTTHFRVLGERRELDKSVPDFMVDEYAPVFHAAKNAPVMAFLVGDTNYDWPARVEENALLAARLIRVYKNKNVKFISIPHTAHGSCGPPSLAIINSWINPKKKR
ncbi:MAG: alpha/beta hydrolase [Lentisphaeria bacterium]|nr:alpha/beta hydrolase [Lentisphaeria bacterium]